MMLYDYNFFPDYNYKYNYYSFHKLSSFLNHLIDDIKRYCVLENGIRNRLSFIFGNRYLQFCVIRFLSMTVVSLSVCNNRNNVFNCFIVLN